MEKQDRESFSSIKFEPVFILVSIAVIMIIFWYYGRVGFFKHALYRYFDKNDFLYKIYPLIYFSLSSVVLRLILPMAIVKFVFKKKLKDFGYSFKGTFKLWYGYLILFAIVFPIVLYSGKFHAFQAKYPFCRDAIVNGQLSLKLFIIYEIFYFFIFVSGEAFWRGYITFGLKPYFGYYSIFIMIIPYSMGHFGKPFPEAIGAIVAGTTLGYLALKHGNFYLGVLLHYGVALSMDLISLFYRGIKFI